MPAQTIFQMAPSSSSGVPPMSGSASVNSDDSVHPSVVSDLFDGYLGEDDLNEIPSLLLPQVDGAALDSFQLSTEAGDGSFLDTESHHLATQVAFTASAIDGALGSFEYSLLAPTKPADVGNGPQKIPIALAAATTTNKRSSSYAAKPKRATKKQKTCPRGKKMAKNTTPNPLSGEDSPTREAILILPCVISPGSSSVSSSESNGDRKAAVTPPIDATMPSLPECTTSSSYKSTLAPKPSSTFKTVAPNPPSKASKTAPVQIAPRPGKADTSTAHIKMLVAENGSAEFVKGIVFSTTTNASRGDRVAKTNLTPEERAKVSRDRNREHARNTRLRKKAYTEELKRTLNEVVSERDAAELRKKQEAQRDIEQREVRFCVLEEFLNLRGNNSADTARWSAILAPGFSLRLPVITEDGNVEESEITGVEEIMAEANRFTGFLQSVGSRNNDIFVTMPYEVERNGFLMDGCEAVLDWVATTHGAIQKGAKAELKVRGTLRARFDPNSNQLVSAAMIFDTGMILSEKKKLFA